VRAKKVAALGLTPEECKEIGRLNAEADMTDFENVHFVYHF
jgi:MFS transporter, ACS family, allantoate permease